MIVSLRIVGARAILYRALLTLIVALGGSVAASVRVARSLASNATYYVDATSGSDSNTGSARNQAWQTIQHAADTMVGGDTAIVLAGAYEERVQIKTSGSAGAPITFRAEGTVQMKGFTAFANFIVISGFDISVSDDYWRNGTGIFMLGSNCVLENNYVHHAMWGGIRINATPGNESTTHHCIVRNNRLYRNALFGIEVFGSDHLIEGNEIWGTIQHHPDWSSPPPSPDADGILFFGTRNVFRGNYIHDITFKDKENTTPHIDCFQTYFDDRYSVVHDILFEGNRCRNLEVNAAGLYGNGFAIEGAHDLTIRNNVIQAFAGIGLFGDAMTIVNNTLISDLTFPGQYGATGITLNESPRSVVENNLIIDFPAYSIHADSATRQGFVAKNNLIYWSNGETPQGLRYLPDLWMVDPKFVDRTGGDFHLQPGSPAIDAGVQVPGITKDFEGNPRPQAGGFDIGAFEAPVASIEAIPSTARFHETIAFTIRITGNGGPATMVNDLASELNYLSSSTTCPGSVMYIAASRQVRYSGTPPVGIACTVELSAEVGTGNAGVVTNTASINNAPLPVQQLSVSVLLNSMRLALPMIRK